MEDAQSVIESFSSARSDAADNLPLGSVSEEKVKQEIRRIADKILCVMPPRLLNTRDGKMYTSTTLGMKFEASDTYRSLLTLTTTRSTLGNERYIAAVVHTFFAYVTLSHRWKGDEPSLNDIAEDGVYSLPASRFDKVRKFCLEARKCGYDWAWIDTCCIDQRSSAEVQTSISSMFLWYRGSALTIIYLFDIMESSVHALLLSEWFRRGWTLQELLAAKVVRLYKMDWTPFPPFSRCTAFNHKDVPEILVALESATGIQQCHIKSYSPSVDHPRMKLRWARGRVTKVKEDEAYCLMGIFGLTMSVRYGEGDRAFSRLLRKIMKCTGDATLLDWVGQPSTQNSCLPSSPRCFSDAPVGIPEMPCTMVGLAWAATLVFVFKSVFRKARSSFRLRNGHNTDHEHSEDKSATLAVIPTLPCNVDGPLHTLRTARSLVPFEGNELPLAKLLRTPLRPYALTPEIHITVPCFVHEVRSLHFTPVSESYYCCADGIRPFSLVTSEKLKTFTDHRSPSRYLLAHSWDPRLSYNSSHVLHTSMPLLRQRLANPFFAMLLEPCHDGLFRRISTTKRIVAELELSPPRTYGVRFLDLH
ncbi:hypothetical protein DFH29DRAFT_226835 [Suillus ampliporus]|nr:hypothetical protein DFH29DRAFT_226835 [Suillus ampliporus]